MALAARVPGACIPSISANCSIPSLKYPAFTTTPRSFHSVRANFAISNQVLYPDLNELEIDTFSKYSGYIAQVSVPEVEKLNDYDIAKIEKLYGNRPFLLLRRLSQIILKLGGWFALRYVDSVSGQSEKTFKARAAELRKALVELGPAFVKIAQAVSSRPDVVSPDYIKELSLLQDKIAPFSTNIAISIIESELGVPVDELFSDITPQPVAAASLGQVYQARLRPNGKVVAVKVQRPGVKAAIALDILILRTLVGYVRSAARINTDLQAVLDEWATSLFKEMDYTAEAENGIRFRKLFGKLPEVKVPEMYKDLSSKKVLIMEWIEGEKLEEAKDLHLVQVGTYCSLVQILQDGFYHADPHPGNLMRTQDGKLAYLDFGMMGEMKQERKDAIIEAALHLINREFDALADDFVTLGFLPPTAQMTDVSVALTGVFQNAVNEGVRNIKFGNLAGNLGRTMYRFKFGIPSYFSLVIRSLTVLEGLAINVDPDYKILGNAYPWIARKVLTDSSPQLRSTLESLLYKDGTFRIDRLESLMLEATKSLSAESLMKTNGSGDNKRLIMLIFGDQGDYIRDVLLDELAKGLDALNRSVLDQVMIAANSSVPVTLPFSGQLFEAQDRKNLMTLQRIINLISNTDSSQDDDEGNDDIDTMQAKIFNLLRNVTSNSSIIFELPFPVQQKVIVLPALLAGRVASRMVARTIRSSIMNDPENKL